MRRRAALVVLALVVLAACAACSDDGGGGAGAGGDGGDRPREEAAVGGTLRLGIGRLASLDPAAATPEAPSTTIAADLLFDGVDVLAEAGSTPDGGRTWTFTLRPGASFGDGTPLTTADVEASLERVPGRPAGLDVRALDAASFEIGLTRPMATLPELLASPAYGIVPATAVFTGDFLAAATAGSGPFRLVAIEGGVLQLARAAEATALLDGVELHQFDDLGDAHDAFEAGRLDWTLVPADRAEAVAERHGTDGFVPSTSVLLFVFDRQDPAFADVRLRRAVVTALDREALVRALYFGVADPMLTLVPGGVAGHDAARCAAGCAHDPALTAQLLAEIGAVPEVVVDRGAGAAGEAVAQAVVAQLTAAGIPAVVGDGGLRQVGIGAAAPTPEPYLGRVAGADAEVRRLLDQLAVTFDGAERATIAAEIEGRLLGAAVAVPVARFKTLSVADDAVRDLDLTPHGTFAAPNVWLAN